MTGPKGSCKPACVQFGLLGSAVTLQQSGGLWRIATRSKALPGQASLLAKVPQGGTQRPGKLPGHPQEPRFAVALPIQALQKTFKTNRHQAQLLLALPVKIAAITTPFLQAIACMNKERQFLLEDSKCQASPHGHRSPRGISRPGQEPRALLLTFGDARKTQRQLQKTVYANPQAHKSIII